MQISVYLLSVTHKAINFGNTSEDMMESFGNILKEYIQSQGFSIYQIAKDTGIERSFLQNVLSGRKKLPQKRFDSIVNLSYFTTAQVRNLCGAYYLEKFGTDKLKRLEMIEKGLTGGIKNELCKEYSPETEALDSNVSFYSGRKDILSVIYFIVNAEHNSTIFSNFKFSDTEINRIIYQVCKSRKIDKFFHYVKDNTGATASNIETMFNTVHYAEIGYLTHYYEKSVNEIMPYFIMTDKYCLQYDENAEIAFLLRSNFAINDKFMSGKLDDIKNKSTVKVTINSDAFAHMMHLQSIIANYNHSNVAGYDNIICPTNITSDIIEAIATPAIKNVPTVIQQLTGHYKVMLEGENCIEKLVVNYNAVSRFVKTGRLEEFPTELAYPVPKEMRAILLKPIIENKNTSKYILTNPNTFKTNYNVAIQIHNNSLMICSCEDYEKEFVGKVLYYTDKLETVNDFKDYLAYMTASEKTYSEEASKKLLKSFLIELEAE